MRSTLVLLVAMAVGGCIDDRGRRYNRGFYPTPCERLVTCGGCTMALGCGWCQSGNDGLCASSPNQCASATTFSWTWEPIGCPGVTGDGGGIDYGKPVEPSSDAGSGGAPDAAVDLPAGADVTAGADGGAGADGAAGADGGAE